MYKQFSPKVESHFYKQKSLHFLCGSWVGPCIWARADWTSLNPPLSITVILLLLCLAMNNLNYCTTLNKVTNSIFFFIFDYLQVKSKELAYFSVDIYQN